MRSAAPCGCNSTTATVMAGRHACSSAGPLKQGLTHTCMRAGLHGNASHALAWCCGILRQPALKLLSWLGCQ